MEFKKYLTNTVDLLSRYPNTVAVALFTIISSVTYVFIPKYELIILNSDDAYYYYEILHNSIEYGWLTFDQINSTNGFHPLWYIILLPIFAITSGKFAPIVAVGILSSLLIGAGSLVLIQYLQSQASKEMIAVILFGVLFYSVIFIRSKMEVILVIPLGFTIFYLMDKWEIWKLEEQPIKYLIMISILMGLIQIARLDAVLLNGVILSSLIIANNINIKIIKPISILCIGPMLTGSGYLAFNYVIFGHIEPVSSLAKSPDHIKLNLSYIMQLTNNLPPTSAVGIYVTLSWMVLTFSLFYILYILYYRISLSGKHYVPIIVAIFHTVHVVYYLIFSSWSPMMWYYYPCIFTIGLVSPHILEIDKFQLDFNMGTVRQVSKIGIICLLIIVSIIAPIGITMLNDTEDFRYQTYELAQYTNENFEVDTVFGMGGKAGSFGYYSNHRVVQLEGITNDYEYIEVIRNKELLKYLDNENIDYIIVANIPKSFINSDYSGQKVSVGRVDLTIPVYSSCEEYTTSGENGYIVIWNVECIVNEHQ